MSIQTALDLIKLLGQNKELNTDINSLGALDPSSPLFVYFDLWLYACAYILMVENNKNAFNHLVGFSSC